MFTLLLRQCASQRLPGLRPSYEQVRSRRPRNTYEKSLPVAVGVAMIYGGKCMMFLIMLTTYPTSRIPRVSYEFSHPIVLSWSGEHACFTFRRSHFHTSTRRPGTLTDVFLCLLQLLQTNNAIVRTTPIYAQPQFRFRLNSIVTLHRSYEA